MKIFTEQEKFWANEFGNEYLNRNQIKDLLPKKINMFSEILKNTLSIKSFLEFGPNSGVNLLAIRNLIPNSILSGVEVNENALDELKGLNICENLWHDSMLNFNKKNIAEMSFTSGVLIHLNPDYLNKAYEALYLSSKRYILICEYYNPTPTSVIYRGHENKLFKRDFAGEILSKYSDLELVNYSFVYKRDNNFPLDDLTWFLLKKK